MNYVPAMWRKNSNSSSSNIHMEIMKVLSILLVIIVVDGPCFPLLSVCGSYVGAIFTFGDSIFDAGNNRFNKNCSIQADFPPYGSAFFHNPTGRFTNGRTVPDFISQFIGIGLQKPFLEAYDSVVIGSEKGYPSNGINFASAGSGVLQGTNKGLGVISIQEQLLQFQTLVNQNHIDKSLVQKSLFLFESGSNDIFNYFIPFGTSTHDPDSYVQQMLLEVSKFMDQIYNIGARRIALFSLGLVGCAPGRVHLPGAPTNHCYEKLNTMVKKYNMGLEILVKDIPNNYPGAVGVYGAVYKIVQQFRAIPRSYGFSDVSAACCGDGILGGELQCGMEGYKICKDPNKFLFWDAFHPSERAYKLISKALWASTTNIIWPINLKNLANITRV